MTNEVKNSHKDISIWVTSHHLISRVLKAVDDVSQLNFLSANIIYPSYHFICQFKNDFGIE